LTINQSSLPSAATNDFALVQRVSGNAVAWLTLQVPEFGGTEEENGKSGFEEWIEWRRCMAHRME